MVPGFRAEFYTIVLFDIHPAIVNSFPFDIFY